MVAVQDYSGYCCSGSWADLVVPAEASVVGDSAVALEGSAAVEVAAEVLPEAGNRKKFETFMVQCTIIRL